MHRFAVLPADVVVLPRPVLFAGLLRHWGHKGPVEIPPKREFFFRYLTWLAERDGIPLAMPPVHPFHPLRALRLAIAAGVFGVPTVGVGGELFWGADATDFVVACLRDPALLGRLDRRVARLPAPPGSP